MTQEPIVMWLGNSSSQPRVIPWSSFNKSLAGAPRNSVAGNSSKGLHDSRKHATASPSRHRSTTGAALRSHSRHPHNNKYGGPGKKRKKGAHGPWKKNKNGGNKKPKKGLIKLHGGKGRSKQRGRKKGKGLEKPAHKKTMKKQMTRRLQTTQSTRGRESSTSTDGSYRKETTRGHRHHHHSPGWGERSQSGKRPTAPSDSERAKASGGGDKASLTWTSTRLEEISTSSSGKSHSNPPGHGDFRGKPTHEPNERNKHFTMSHHQRRPPGLLRLHVKWKPYKFTGSTETVRGGGPQEHQMPHHGRLPQTSSPPHGKLRETPSSSSNKMHTISSLDKRGHKEGSTEVTIASSQSSSKTSSTITGTPKAESSNPMETTGQGTIEKHDEPANSSGSSSNAKPTSNTKTHVTKSLVGGSPKNGTGSSGRAKSGTRAEVTTVSSKASSGVTSLLTALNRLEEARKNRNKTTENEAALTKQPEGKAGQDASMSPVPTPLTGGGKLSSLLRTIPVKAPEASTSKSRR
ncbi:hypothetical protein HPB51_002182 [Rhipicephalus microplus]|uniref:Uncharacterized protein n=1 Tax=Rhipicephalus microplus TaxID=6941 RepID=A0A9J6EL36_RHIMP|nr:hypothetical protein HPB51_002182 [Rhipicephalus microplus]